MLIVIDESPGSNLSSWNVASLVFEVLNVTRQFPTPSLSLIRREISCQVLLSSRVLEGYSGMDHFVEWHVNQVRLLMPDIGYQVRYRTSWQQYQNATCRGLVSNVLQNATHRPSSQQSQTHGWSDPASKWQKSVQFAIDPQSLLLNTPIHTYWKGLAIV